MNKLTTKLPPELDRRKKLSVEQKECIKSLAGEFSITELAKEFYVSRRCIEFIVFPERRQKNTEGFKAGGGWRKHYTTEAGTKACAKTREYKKSLLKQGLL